MLEEVPFFDLRLQEKQLSGSTKEGAFKVMDYEGTGILDEMAGSGGMSLLLLLQVLVVLLMSKVDVGSRIFDILSRPGLITEERQLSSKGGATL